MIRKTLLFLFSVLLLSSCSGVDSSDQIYPEVRISIEKGIICLESNRGVEVTTNEGLYEAESWCNDRTMQGSEVEFEDPIEFIFFEEKFCMSLQEDEVRIYWMDGEDVDEIEMKKEFCYSVFSIPDNGNSGGETYLFSLILN